MQKVYLAGPISGLTFDGASDWREYVNRELPFACFSPLRAKEYLRKVGNITGTGEEYKGMSPLSDPKGVMTRDHWDVRTCDLLFVNLLGANQISIGTVMEIAWGHAYRKPIVLVMEPGNVHEHMMLQEAAGFVVSSLDEGIAIACAILLPGGVTVRATV